MEINPAYYRKWLIINDLTHLVNFLGYFSSGFILDLTIVFVTKVVQSSVEINTINELNFIIEMDINRKDYSENRLIKRINEARNYKSKYSNMVAAAYAAGKSSTEVRDEMSSWFAKNAARTDINKEARQNRSQMRSEHNTT